MQAARRSAIQGLAPMPSRQSPRVLAPPAASSPLRQPTRQSAATTVVAAAAADADADPFFLASVDEMQQAMRQFDRDMDSIFWGGRSPFFEAERQIDRALRRADEAAADARRQATTTTAEQRGGNVRVERSESRAPGSYRYYERIEISSGGWGQPTAPLATAAATAAPPLLLLVALVAAGAYAAVAAAFARRFDLTLYAERDKARLALTWPLLILTSRSFRSQFVTAVVRGERVRVTNGGGGGGGDFGGGVGEQQQQQQQQQQADGYGGVGRQDDAARPERG